MNRPQSLDFWSNFFGGRFNVRRAFLCIPNDYTRLWQCMGNILSRLKRNMTAQNLHQFAPFGPDILLFDMVAAFLLLALILGFIHLFTTLTKLEQLHLYPLFI